MLSFGYPHAAPGGAIAGRRFEVAGLPLWSAAVRRAQAGQGRARVLCLGDSTTAGFGSVVRADAWPRRLAGLMTSRGGRETNLFSDANLAVSYDARMVRGAGWTKNGSKTLGGFLWLNSTTANAMTFTPQTAFDTVDVFTYGGGGITVAIGAGTPVSFAAGGGVLSKQTVTVAQAGLTRGLHAVSITRNGSATLSGLNCHTAASGIDVMNAGVAGWKASDFSGSAYAADAAFSLIAPDLTIITLAINDYNQTTPTTQASFKASVQGLIDKAKLTGDVLLVVPNDTGGTYAANRAAFVQYVRDLAATNGLKTPLDLADVLGGYATANAAGDMLDMSHPSAQGHGKIAAAIHRSIA
ncbi:SGNH/GDSL hydrolase family protein [Brevundimonas staleyi]|uniref:SGNH/GDSL hydrolase family protein n=1 Tax=Brevundimonas staleyi TaxID=74326 RepID=A0ABW0FMZ9_9CAUL